LLHLMFRCDGDVMESDVFVGVFGGSKHTQCWPVPVLVNFAALVMLP